MNGGTIKQLSGAVKRRKENASRSPCGKKRKRYNVRMEKLMLNITKRRMKRIVVEMDATRLERLATALGFYSDDFIKSLERAERDVKEGRVKKLSSMRDLS